MFKEQISVFQRSRCLQICSAAWCIFCCVLCCSAVAATANELVVALCQVQSAALLWHSFHLMPAYFQCPRIHRLLTACIQFWQIASAFWQTVRHQLAVLPRWVLTLPQHILQSVRRQCGRCLLLRAYAATVLFGNTAGACRRVCLPLSCWAGSAQARSLPSFFIALSLCAFWMHIDCYHQVFVPGSCDSHGGCLNFLGCASWELLQPTRHRGG
jgi:hypothetical protein